MNRVRVFGTLISATGFLLALYMAASTNVNPNLTLIDGWLAMGIFGILVIGVDALARRTKMNPHGRADTNGARADIHRFGLAIIVIGGLAAFGGFLLSNQIGCSCPANIPCDCGLFFVGMMYVGLASMIAGIIAVVVYRA